MSLAPQDGELSIFSTWRFDMLFFYRQRIDRLLATQRFGQIVELPPDFSIPQASPRYGANRDID
jgi:hypothetical protein